MEQIAIFIPDKEAEKYILFQKHYATFMTLVESGVFDQKNGTITIHFDAQGVIQVLQRADNLYVKRVADRKA